MHHFCVAVCPLNLVSAHPSACLPPSTLPHLTDPPIGLSVLLTSLPSLPLFPLFLSLWWINNSERLLLCLSTSLSFYLSAFYIILQTYRSISVFILSAISFTSFPSSLHPILPYQTHPSISHPIIQSPIHLSEHSSFHLSTPSLSHHHHSLPSLSPARTGKWPPLA